MTKYCRSQSQADAETEEWIKTSLGVQMLGSWGAQCALYSQRFSRALFGVSEYSTHGYGDARDIIDNASRNYFDVIWNDPSKPNLLPRRGDIIIWNGKPLWGGLYGHIAIVLNAGPSRVEVQQLDGAAPPTRLYPGGINYSVRPVHKALFAYINDPGVGDVRGWIRPKWNKVVDSGAVARGYGKASTAAPVAKTPASYKLDHRPSPLYTPKASVPSVYGMKRKVTGVTIHWWNLPHLAGNHDGTASYLARAGGNTSAHYVVSPGRATQLVAPQHAAWHAGSARGNATTIGIECDPRDIPGTLPTIAALIRDLEKTYGSLLLYKHSDWTSTSCPGEYGARIPELVSLINKKPAAATVSPAALATAQQAITAPKTETVLEWIVSNKDEAEALMRRVAREEFLGTMDHITAEVDDRGKKIMNRVRDASRQGVGGLVIEGTEESPGQMTFAKHLMYARRERARDEDLRTQVSETHAGVKTLAMGVLSIIGKLTPARTGAHAADTTTEQEV